VDKARNEHSIALPMVSTLFERGDYDNRTKESKVSVRDARLSVLGACTSDTYASLFDHQFHAIGFLNRLWLVVDRSSARIAVPAPIPLTDLEALRQAVLERLAVLDADYTAAGLQAVRYRLTPDALGCFRAWYEARDGSIFERRLDTYGHRLMLLLAATTGHREINADVAGRVVALLRYQLEVRWEVDPVDAETLIAAVEEKVRRALARGALKGRDLKRKIHADRVGIWAWETALANLKRTGEVAHDRGSDVFWRPDPVAGVTTTVTTPPVDESTNGHATF
jgi:hypothetical protein